jgi:hypothetical protein
LAGADGPPEAVAELPELPNIAGANIGMAMGIIPRSGAVELERELELWATAARPLRRAAEHTKLAHARLRRKPFMGVYLPLTAARKSVRLSSLTSSQESRSGFSA